MTIIESNAYGKTRVRLTYVDRTKNPHDLRELSVAILFEGDFESAYRDGDNSRVLPTDTMKNAVYVLARRLSWDSIETLARGLADHFLESVPHLSDISVDIDQISWGHIGEHASAFLQAGNERRTTRVKASRSGYEMFSGLTGLQILKTADSGFSGFLKDCLTTLPETEDRLFGTVLEAEWVYQMGDVSSNEAHYRVRNTLLDSFARHRSLSVQHTLFAMGNAVLEQIGNVASIHLVMPNKHCLLFDLSRFGFSNNNQIFVPTDEPSGYIEARLMRSGSS